VCVFITCVLLYRLLFKSVYCTLTPLDTDNAYVYSPRYNIEYQLDLHQDNYYLLKSLQTFLQCCVFSLRPRVIIT